MLNINVLKGSRLEISAIEIKEMNIGMYRVDNCM